MGNERISLLTAIQITYEAMQGGKPWPLFIMYKDNQRYTNYETLEALVKRLPFSTILNCEYVHDRQVVTVTRADVLNALSNGGSEYEMYVQDILKTLGFKE